MARRAALRHRRSAEGSAAVAKAVHFDRVDGFITAAIALVTFALYAQVVGHQFVNLDDGDYIRDNPHVNRGLSFAGIAWAFTTFHASNWHPLTWLSHMLDCQLFGLNAGAHLLENTFIHIANAALVFLLLRRITGARWRSAIVAALFAWHPLHVESVAWAAERKDTLSTFFGLLSLLAYVRYAKAPTARHYLAVCGFLVLGLLAKPMLVTWPFVMLLLDYWPLRRVTIHVSLGRDYLKLIREKLPLFAIVAASSIMTYLAQAHGGAVRTAVDAPLWFRFSNASISYIRYLAKTFWPHDLAAYYPYEQGSLSVVAVLGSVVLLIAITALCWTQLRARSYLLTGWLWFLGTLVPVIGAVQVGGQIMADRYHYIPSLGLFTALVFFSADLMRASRFAPQLQAAIAAIPLLACLPLTAKQISLWRDSETLFTHTLRVTPPNYLMEYNSGLLFGRRGEYEKAVGHFQRALEIKPDDADTLLDLGITLSHGGRLADAVPYFERSSALKPSEAKPHFELGLALANLNQNDRAASELQRAVDLAPADAETRANLGLVLLRLRKVSEAETQLREAIRLDPRQPEAHNNLGLLLLATGHSRESIPEFEAALQLKPDLHIAQENLCRARQQLSRQP